MYNSLFNDSVNRPLFRESTFKDKFILIMCGLTPSILNMELLFSAFSYKPKAIHIILTILMLFLNMSNLKLIHWYKQGELDPKFRKLIILNSLILVSVEICYNILIFFR
ncbi:unnamed protein product [Brachionus calyciflorus]|uniref:Uncharacterized protein n=1 Tax=Brachionus calyciflorus TaxID=104777 RepID=A0A814C4W6_9BILA|nr:unnamed protein product [Brachionus calyciflorus]